MADSGRGAPSGPVIVGVGSALVDVLTHQSEEFLERSGAVKGGMVYVDNAHIERTLTLTGGGHALVPGGSACNALVGVGMLGGQARFVGKCGEGPVGRFFEDALKTRGVEPRLSRSRTPTGRVLSIVTPDAQRSMFTYLGAAAEIRVEDILAEDFEGAAVVHIEGYLLFNPEVMRAALKAAKSAGAMVSLDLASFNVVEQARGFLSEMVGDYVDILLANEDEARAYTGMTDPQAAVRALGREVDIAALKLGAAGSLVERNGEVLAIDPRGDGTAIDTTGAGDLWAAGFLHGLTRGFSLKQSGELGSACGYEVCQVMGASIPEEGWQRIRKLIELQDGRETPATDLSPGRAA
jgi:sugar/nucleoside kinase (ribokinase family)